MSDSLSDKFKDTANKTILTGVMAVQTVMGIGQKNSEQYPQENLKAQEEIVADPGQNKEEKDTLTADFVPVQTTENSTQTQSFDNQQAQPEISEIQQKYGFDLTYLPQEGMFILKQDGKYDRGITEESVQYDSWAENLQKQRDKIYSHDTEINYEEVDLCKHLENERGIFIARQCTDNTIDVYKYNVKPEDRDYCIRLLQGEAYGLSETEAERTFNIMTSKDEMTRYSLIAHEKVHSKDMKDSKLDQYDLPPEQMVKLEMLTEVHAYMEQAGIALDMYKKDGTLKYFDEINFNMEGIKTALQQNPNMENKEGMVASYVFNKFMEDQNKDGTTYSDQAYRLASPHSYRTDYRVWSYVDNEANKKEYHKRVDEMFKDVQGLGDVRKYIDPDFELHSKLKDKVTEFGIVNPNFKAVMGNGADHPKQYAQNLNDYMQKVKEVDADGIRTPEEVAQLDAYIQKRVNSEEPKVQNVSEDEKAKIASLSGRSGKYQSPETVAQEDTKVMQPAENTVVNPAPKAAEKMPIEPLQTEVPIPTPSTDQNQTQTKPQPQVQASAPVVEAQPVKKVADMSPKEKYDFINNNLRKGKNPNLSIEAPNAPVRDNTKVASNTLSQQQIIQTMVRRNAGNGMK